MMDSQTLWLAIIGAALGTFAVRISFLGPWARARFPDLLQRALAYAPAVIFAALITPMLLKTGTGMAPLQLIPYVSAALVTLAWAWWRGGQGLPLVAGMTTLHAVKVVMAIA
jgi:branched-subunit amino acid transport protein